MFKSLFVYEEEKFWSKKINIACFISVPLIVCMALKGCIESNTVYGINSPAFSTNLNFHITAFQEMLVTAFNLITIIIFVLGFNEEYQSGNLRMAFTRPVSIKKLYFAKTAVLVFNLLLLVLLQLLISVVFAQIFLPKAVKTFLFFKKGAYGMPQIIIYSFKFYLIGFLSLLVLGTAVEIFSVKCRTVTGAIIGSVIFFVINVFIYILVIYLFKGSSDTNSVYIGWASLSIFFSEFKGAAYFAAGVSNFCLYSLIIIFAFIKTISFFSFNKKDYLE